MFEARVEGVLHGILTGQRLRLDGGAGTVTPSSQMMERVVRRGGRNKKLGCDQSGPGEIEKITGFVAQQFRRLTDDSADPVSDLLDQVHNALLNATIRHLRKCANETKRIGRVKECENGTSVLRSAEFFVEKHRHGYVENFCKLLQATRSNSADALFVLLHLLIGDSQRVAESLLG
jgi:hypothetical protein